MSNKEQVEIVIDSNEAAMNESLPEKFVLHEDVSDWRIEPLSEGDIKIGECLFERKTPEDFASSVMEGRMREQAQRLGGQDMVSYIVIEGDMEDFSNLSHSDIPPKSLRGMVASVMARNRVPVVFCSTEVQLADFCVRAARKHKEDAQMTFQRSHDDLKKDVGFFRRSLIQLEGIGPETADKIAEQFSDLQEFISAPISQYTNVEGIGSKTAEKIKEQVDPDDKSSSEPDNQVYTV